MMSLRSSILLAGLILLLNGCGDGSAAESKDAFSIANSAEGFQCQTELRKEGIIGKNQGFTLYTGKEKTTAELNSSETSTFRMTIEEFRKKCAEYGLKP